MYILVGTKLAIGQEHPLLIPIKADMPYGACDSSLSVRLALLRQAKEWNYQPFSKFYEDNVQSVDIDQDGQCEYILKYYDGGANIQEEIYRMVDSKLIKIAYFWEGTYSWRAPYRGWPQILLHYYTGRKTNPIWQFSLYRFDGDEYVRYYDPGLTAGALRDLGLQKYHEGSLETAELYFRNVLTVYGNESTVDVNNLALALMKQNKLEEANALLTTELKRQPSAPTYFNLSLLARKQSEWQRELQYLRKSNLTNTSEAKVRRIKEIEMMLKLEK